MIVKELFLLQLAKFTEQLKNSLTEIHPIQAQSPYAATKISADHLLESFVLSFGMPAVILRPFNTYGPRQSERAFISGTIRQLLDKNCNFVEVGSLAPKRDFNYVDDTVNAFILLANLSEKKLNMEQLIIEVENLFSRICAKINKYCKIKKK